MNKQQIFNKKTLLLSGIIFLFHPFLLFIRYGNVVADSCCQVSQYSPFSLFKELGPISLLIGITLLTIYFFKEKVKGNKKYLLFVIPLAVLFLMAKSSVSYKETLNNFRDCYPKEYNVPLSSSYEKQSECLRNKGIKFETSDNALKGKEIDKVKYPTNYFPYFVN